MRFLILLLLSLPLSVWPQTEQNPPTATKTFEVQGTVVEAVSNEPIRKALVTLKKGEDGGIGTYTNDMGHFVLREVDPGAYLISATHIGFIAGAKAFSQSITVQADSAVDQLLLKLNRTGAVSGHILDANGEPAVGAGVELRPLNQKKNQSVTAFVNSDDRGNYRVYNVAPGKYKVSFVYSSRNADPRVRIQVEKDKAKNAYPDVYGITYYPGTLDPAQATIIQVEPGADIQGIDIGLRLTNAVRVRGKITSVDGELPAPLVMVALARLNGGNACRHASTTRWHL